MRRLVIGLLVALAIILPAAAQQSPLTADEAFRLTATREADGALAISWTIEEGYYLYRDKMSAALVGADGEQPLSLEIPAGTPYADPWFGSTEIYHNGVTATIPAPALAASEDEASVRLTYQGCAEDGICYPPLTRTVDLATLTVQTEDASGPLSGQGTWNAESPVLPEEPDGDSFVSALVADGGFAWLILSFAGFGLLLSLTPCVFPMIPILSGVLARDGAAMSARRGFVLSGVYVLAMATAYGLLGLAAAWSGQNLQMALQSPLAIGVMSVIFVALALSMFGLFDLQLPAAWTARIAGKRLGAKGSLAGTAFIGFTSALIVSPCVTPPLAGALLYIAQTADMARGAAALFALGLGMGLPLVVFGTAGSSLMPRAGAWMESIKHVFGVLFLAVAIWMSARVLSAPATLALWAILLIGSGVFLGAFDALAGDASPFRRIRKAAGILATLYGSVLVIGAAGGADDPLRPLGMFQAASRAAPEAALPFTTVTNLPDLERQVSAARGAGRPVFVNFTADWCVVCKEIERDVLNAPEVQAKLRDLTLIHADVTTYDAGSRELMRAFDVVGPPTLLFLDPTAREVPDARIIGLIDAKGFLARLAMVEGA